MTHFLADSVVDLAANHLKNNVTKIILCDGAPTTYGDAVTNHGSGSGVRLAEVTVDSSDFTVQNGTPDGREVVVVEQTSIPVVAAGDGDHVAWVDVPNTTLLKVCPVPAPLAGLTTSATVTIPTHKHVFRDATALT